MFADLQDGCDETDVYSKFLLHKLSPGGQSCHEEDLERYEDGYPPPSSPGAGRG